MPYKLSIWVISAVMCGIAGALYVPQVGIINPGEMSAANSIEMAIWAAVGGRGTLIGPIVGAFLVNGAKSWLTVTAPEFWLYFLGALFIVVTLYLPNGVVGLFRSPNGIFKYFRRSSELPCHSRECGNPGHGSPIKSGMTQSLAPGMTETTEKGGAA